MNAQQITAQDVDAWHTQMCQALRFGAMLDNFPSMVERCLDLRTWEKRQCRDLGRPFHSPLEYFTYNEPDGVGTSDEQVRLLLRDHHRALEKWDGATRTAVGVNQHTIEGHNNIMTLQGTSKAYLLKRLQEKHKSLFKRTLLPKKLPSGEKNPKYLSPYAAAKEAGIIVPPTPFEQVQKLLPKLTPTEKRKLRELLE